MAPTPLVKPDFVPVAKAAIRAHMARTGIKYRNHLCRDLGVKSADMSRLFLYGYCSPKLWYALLEHDIIDGKEYRVSRAYEPCPGCGGFHKMRTCTRQRQRRQPVRFLAPRNDVEEMAELLEKHYPGRFALNGRNGVDKLDPSS